MRFVGVHYAITADQRDGLLAQADDAKKMEYFGAEIEEKWEEEHGQISDTAWEAIHCCLTAAATFLGVDSAGVRIRCLSLSNSPVSVSTSAALMPVPPTSMPRMVAISSNPF